MADTPSRPEIMALLEAAESRTAAQMTQFAATMEKIALTSDHRFEVLTGKIDSVAKAVEQAQIEVRDENRQTRHTIIGIGLGAALALAGLGVSLWVAGINQEANLLSMFQAALTVQSAHKEAPPLPAAAPAPPPAAK